MLFINLGELGEAATNATDAINDLQLDNPNAKVNPSSASSKAKKKGKGKLFFISKGL